ncbi:MAG: hypothetical protein ABR567_10670 [Myxococcales bacterium]|nr:hypothetical protein [Myxococcales bacterium]
MPSLSLSIAKYLVAGAAGAVIAMAFGFGSRAAPEEHVAIPAAAAIPALVAPTDDSAEPELGAGMAESLHAGTPAAASRKTTSWNR